MHPRGAACSHDPRVTRHIFSHIRLCYGHVRVYHIAASHHSDEAMATHFVFCPRCREQKQVQAANGQKNVACPACRLPLLVERPVAPLVSPEVKSSANQPIAQNPPLLQVPFPEGVSAGRRRSASWTIKIMIGSILILTLAAFSLGAFILARKYSTTDVASLPATPPLNTGEASSEPSPRTSGTTDTRTPNGPITPREAPDGLPEPAPSTGTGSAPASTASNVSPPETPASPETVQDALKLAEEGVSLANAEREKAKAAFDEKNYSKALTHNERCLTILRRLRDETTVAQVKSAFNDMLSSESNRRILFCYSAVDESDISNGISESWKTDLDSLTPPAKLVDGRDLCQQDWKVNVAYASLQQHLADYAIRREDYAQAGWRFSAAETYFDLYEQEAPANILNDPESRSWRKQNKDRLEQLISTRGIRDGMFVQNNGILQLWIGRVIQVEGDNLIVRITYASDRAPQGFLPTKEISLKRDELKPIAGLSVDAILNGYR